MELENIILSKVSQTPKDMHGICSLMRILATKHRLSMLHSTDSKKINTTKSLDKDSSFSLRRGNKIVMGANGGELGRRRDREANRQWDQVWEGTGEMAR